MRVVSMYSVPYAPYSIPVVELMEDSEGSCRYSMPSSIVLILRMDEKNDIHKIEPSSCGGDGGGSPPLLGGKSYRRKAKSRKRRCWRGRGDVITVNYYYQISVRMGYWKSKSMIEFSPSDPI